MTQSVTLAAVAQACCAPEKNRHVCQTGESFDSSAMDDPREVYTQERLQKSLTCPISAPTNLVSTSLPSALIPSKPMPPLVVFVVNNEL